MGNSEVATQGQGKQTSSRATRTLTVFEAIAVALVGVSIVALLSPTPSAHALNYDQTQYLKNFTVLVANDADLQHGSGGGQLAGSLAAGGNVSFGTYDLTAPSEPGATLPSVDGPNVQLLVGGTVSIDDKSSRLVTNAGRARVTDTTGMQVSPDRRLYRLDQQRHLLNQSGSPQNSVGNPAAASDYTATPGAFTGAFVSVFPQLRQVSAELQALTAADGVAIVSPVNEGGRWTITLQPNVPNVLFTDAATLAGVSEVNFAQGVIPDTRTPLVINVSSTAGTSVRTPRFNGGVAHHAKHTLWNFSGWTSLTLSAGGGEMGGTVLAPDADLLYARDVAFQGQIVAKSIVIRGSGAIQHWAFVSPIATTPTPTATPTGSPSAEPTPSPEPSESETAEPTPEPSVSETAEPTPEPSPSESETAEPTPEPSPSGSESPPPPSGTASGDVTFSDETCESLGEWRYQVDVGTHVRYTQTVEGVTSELQPGTHTPSVIGVEYVIEAIADQGFVIEGPSMWTHTFSYAEGCLPDHALVAGIVSVVHANCTGDSNSFSVVEVHGIRYFQTLAGATVPLEPGVYTTVVLGSPYIVTAEAEDGFGLEPGQPSSWSFEFSEASGCQLPTLAFTGVSPWWWALGLGGIAAIVLGIFLIIDRQRRRREEQLSQ